MLLLTDVFFQLVSYHGEETDIGTKFSYTLFFSPIYSFKRA